MAGTRQVGTQHGSGSSDGGDGGLTGWEGLIVDRISLYL